MALNIERWTTKSQQALSAAESLARIRGHQDISECHLLLALLEQAEGTVEKVLRKAGLDAAAVEREVRKNLESRPKLEGDFQHTLADSFRTSLEHADKRRKELKDEFLDRKSVV